MYGRPGSISGARLHVEWRQCINRSAHISRNRGFRERYVRRHDRYTSGNPARPQPQRVKMQPLELTGQRFGKLLVLQRVWPNKEGKTQWKCQCDCGKTCVLTGTSLTKRIPTHSCRCIQRAMIRNSRCKRPFEWAYKKLVSNATKRGFIVEITYEDYLDFTKIPNCVYCLKNIP